MGRMTLITGVERRRRWSEEDRSRILAAISEPGAVVADVARREDICTSLVYKWRRAARREESAPTFGFSPGCQSALKFGSDANLMQPFIIWLGQVALQEGRVSRARTSGA